MNVKKFQFESNGRNITRDEVIALIEGFIGNKHTISVEVVGTAIKVSGEKEEIQKATSVLLLTTTINKIPCRIRLEK